MNGLKSKVFRMDADEDLVIEAYAPVDGNQEAFRKLAFKASFVDYLYEIDDTRSGMVLKNGVAIPVNLAFARLKESIYQPDMTTGTGIDLTLVTGKVVGEVERLRLSKSFNPAADAPKAAAAGKDLVITLFAHEKPDDRQFRRIEVKASQIDFFEAHTGRMETETFIALKDGQEVEGMKRFYAALPLDHFTYYLNQAKLGGDATLDLAERTRPKNTKTLEMK